jgi:aminobenzoyl-glutamate transport protein
MTTHHTDTAPRTELNALYRAIATIERVGNKLPHPFWLFWILTGILGVASLALSLFGVSAILPKTGEVVAVKNLLSLDGVTYAAQSALDNLAKFPPLAVIVVMLLGVSVAERSGLLEALLRVTVVRLPGRWVTFAIAFSGMVAHIMADSAYLVMIPLGALAFRAAGRSPVLGVMVAYVSVSAGYNASPFVTPSDAIRASLAATAAQTIDPGYVVTPVATWFFSAASSLLLAVVITAVVELVLAGRPEFAPTPEDDDEEQAVPAVHLSDVERRGLRLTAAALVLFVATVVTFLLVPGSPLLGKGGSILSSVAVVNISAFIALLFALLGFVYGRATGTITSLGALPTIMADGLSKIAPVIVLFFAVSQFLAYFTWTGIGSVITVEGADFLRSLDAPHLLILLAILLGVCVLNLLITSGSAMWAVLAPVLVPMMMYLQIRPEAAMVSFMIGDSVTNAVTPMSPYFILALGFVQQYRKNAGIGTLMSFTVPVAAAILVAWSTFFTLWYLLGIPLGPGVPLR